MDNLDTTVPSKQLDWNNILRQGAFAGLALTAFSIITYLIRGITHVIFNITIIARVLESRAARQGDDRQGAGARVGQLSPAPNVVPAA